MTETTDLLQKIAGLSPEKRALLEAKLLRGSSGAPATIPRRTGSGPAPLSFSQQRLWFLDQLDPNRPYYNLPLAVRVTGALDVAALTRALDTIVARHEVLRTTYVARGGEACQIVGAPRPLTVERRSLKGLPESQRPAALQALPGGPAREAFRSRPGLNDSSDPRRGGRGRSVLVLMMHHIASDGWSVGVLFDELAAHYGSYAAGAAPDLPLFPFSIRTMRSGRGSGCRGRSSGTSSLTGRSSSKESSRCCSSPPTGRGPPGRPSRGLRRDGSSRSPWPSGSRRSRRESGATLFMTLLAAFQTLLSRLSGQEDVPSARRSPAAAGWRRKA